MKLIYALLHNADAMFMRPGTPDDRYVRGHVGEVHVKDDDTIIQTLETVFAIHNHDNRPDGKKRPSLSVGDVVILGAEQYWTVDTIGFRQLEALPGALYDEYPER